MEGIDPAYVRASVKVVADPACGGEQAGRQFAPTLRPARFRNVIDHAIEPQRRVPHVGQRGERQVVLAFESHDLGPVLAGQRKLAPRGHPGLVERLAGGIGADGKFHQRRHQLSRQAERRVGRDDKPESLPRHAVTEYVERHRGAVLTIGKRPHQTFQRRPVAHRVGLTQLPPEPRRTCREGLGAQQLDRLFEGRMRELLPVEPPRQPPRQHQHGIVVRIVGVGRREHVVLRAKLSYQRLDVQAFVDRKQGRTLGHQRPPVIRSSISHAEL